jgi:hypothetical protein
VTPFTGTPAILSDKRRMNGDDDRNRTMTHTAMDTPSLQELAAIETDSRFFKRLLLAAGIAASALIGAGVVWHESELGGGAPPAQQQEQAPPHVNS